MQNHPYFIKAKPVVLAHRGFTPPVENTLGAFQHGLGAGADYLETDVRATADGIAVLVHDADLVRLTGSKKRISELTHDELKGQIEVATLLDALEKFPMAKFNLDIKADDAIRPTVQAIEFAKAHERVLVSSFSNKRRTSAIALLTKPVATSASGSIVFRAWLMNLFGIKLDGLLAEIGALQIPIGSYGMRFDRKRFIQSVSDTGTLIHFWTINDESEMRRLVALGAHGIVTDKTDLAVKTLKKSK
ncbi:MAG: glycerophosphodiester phosphodiesterase [Micrococcales bacterium]|nr:glycerophosphodiester phosphodiesterase [Micrococcales bacterium]